MSGFTVELSLLCSTTGESSHAQLILGSFPSCSTDLMKEIEKAHQIPTFAQTQLTYGDQCGWRTEITDDENLSNALLRNGDTIWVTYTAKAECREIEMVVEYLQRLAASLNDYLPSDSNDGSLSATLLHQAITGGVAQLLRKDLFMPWKSEVKQMNKEVFIRRGGLDHLTNLLRIIHTRPWNSHTHNVKLLEIVILEALHPLAAIFKFRRLLLQQGVVDLCLRSLLQTKLERRATFGDRVLPYLLAKAMTSLCNMCELHETSVKIASSPEALEQFICIAHSSYYDAWHAQVVLNLFACLSNVKDVHCHVASESVIGGIIDICFYRSELGDTALDVMLLRYYTQLAFMQLIMLSPSYLSIKLLKRMEHHMTAFLADVDVVTLSNHEVSCGNFWSVFEPFVRLLYVPNTPLDNHQGGSLLSGLQLSSIQSSILALHVIMLTSEDGHKSLDTMRQENLISYIIAAPSHVPPTLRMQAKELVRCLGRYIPIDPPTLVDLAKASLAKYRFGLERMLHLQTPYELVQEYYSL